MNAFLGIDTSNYTTSLALCYTDEGGKLIDYVSIRRILEVEKGSKGLRQSEAHFNHTKVLPELSKELFEISRRKYPDAIIRAVACSDKPRNVEGSYMPCFLAGLSAASLCSYALNVPFYKFSHQCMHIAAALYSSGREDLFDIPHLAYHVSGGTTEILHVCRSKNGFDCKILGKTLDISAGQLIDRVGVMLGLAFPAGAELEKLAMEAKPIKVKTCVKGCNVNFSGTENLCQKMMFDGISPQAIARYAIDTVKCTLLQSAKNAAALYPDETIVFAGGVTGNSIIRQALSDETNAVFADGGLSSDNAVGTAVLCARRYYSNDGEE